MKRITIEQAKKLCKEKVQIDYLGSFGLRKMREIIPFSWTVFCRENKLNPELLMDRHEKRIRRSERK